jgi:hypothetical protein
MEAAGLATVAVYIEAFAHYAEAMRLPRTLVVPHPMGRPIGAPGDAVRHREVVEAALRMVDTADRVGTIERLGGSYWPLRLAP